MHVVKANHSLNEDYALNPGRGLEDPSPHPGPTTKLESTRKFYHHWHILHHSHWHVVRDGLLSTHKSPNFPWPSLSSV